MMKKLLVVLGLGLLVCFMATGAWAYNIDNITEVLPTTDGINPSGPWQSAKTNPIGYFNTYGADWNATTKILTIYSNWGQARDNETPGVTTADLFIDANGVSGWDFSIGLDSLGRQGKTYTGAITPAYTFPNYITGLQYRYPSAASAIPIFMANEEIAPLVSVTWSPAGGTPDYKVAVDLTGLVGNNFNFFWASGTCGNGPIEGKVPLPGAVLLLGAGMARLVAYARRRQA